MARTCCSPLLSQVNCSDTTKVSIGSSCGGTDMPVALTVRLSVECCGEPECASHRGREAQVVVIVAGGDDQAVADAEDLDVGHGALAPGRRVSYVVVELRGPRRFQRGAGRRPAWGRSGRASIAPGLESDS